MNISRDLDSDQDVTSLEVNRMHLTPSTCASITRFVEARSPEHTTFTACDFALVEKISTTLSKSSSFPIHVLGSSACVIIDACTIGGSVDCLNIWDAHLAMAIYCSGTLQSLTIIDTLHQFKNSDSIEGLGVRSLGLKELHLSKNRIWDYYPLAVTLGSPLCKIASLTIDCAPSGLVYSEAVTKFCAQCMLFSNLESLALTNHASLVIPEAFMRPPLLRQLSTTGSNLTVKSMINLFNGAVGCEVLSVGRLCGAVSRELAAALIALLESPTPPKHIYFERQVTIPGAAFAEGVASGRIMFGAHYSA